MATKMGGNMAVKLHLPQYLKMWRSQNDDSCVKPNVFMGEEFKNHIQNNIELKGNNIVTKMVANMAADLHLP